MADSSTSKAGTWGLGHRYWIAITYFLFAAVPGSWFPTIASTLVATGWEDLVGPVFLIMPITGLISPLLFAAWADQRYNAEWILAGIIGVGTIFLYPAFVVLGEGENKPLFIGLMIANGLIVAPAWSLINTIALRNLPSSRFGLYRGWATAGWALAGVTVSWLAADASAKSGELACVIRIAAGLACLFLPRTPPAASAPKGWRDSLGLGGFAIFKSREITVYFVAAFLLAIPTAAHYMHTPLQLTALGIKSTAGWMTVCQATELIALVSMGFLFTRFRLRTIFLIALACAIARFGLYVVGAQTSSAAMVLLGLCFGGVNWALFFETGRVFVDRRVDAGLRTQAQALLGVLTMGVGSICGTILVEKLRQVLVPDAAGTAGWATYWSILCGFCVVAGLVYLIGGRPRTGDGSSANGRL